MHYIAFLRGINVGGHQVKMERLRALFEELGFQDVRSYIQTGNVFFYSNETDGAILQAKIAAHLTNALGYDVPTFVRTIDELQDALVPSPFEGVQVTEDIRLAVLFISQPLPVDIHLPLEITKGGIVMSIIKITEGTVFIVMDQSSKRPGNPVQYVEKTYGVRATARFYHTALKILEAAKNNHISQAEEP